MLNIHLEKWRHDLYRISAVNNTGSNKLRTYRLFKDCYEVESYCKMHMPYAHRSSLAKFRCGVAPLRLGTGRYENLSVNERTCPFCKSVVESEKHVLLECPLYATDRHVLFL